MTGKKELSWWERHNYSKLKGQYSRLTKYAEELEDRIEQLEIALKRTGLPQLMENSRVVFNKIETNAMEILSLKDRTLSVEETLAENIKEGKLV